VVYLDFPLHKYTALVSNGYLGVDFFFVLSGAILSHVYMDSWESRTFSYKKFLIKRFARIYPIHLVTLSILVFYSLSIVALSLDLDSYVPWERFSRNLTKWGTLPAQFLLLHGIGFGGEGWNYPSWSISCEWFAYVLFPVFLLVALRFSRGKPLALSLAAYVALGISYFAMGLDGLHQSNGIFRIVFVFMIGCSLYMSCRTVTFRYGYALCLLAATFLCFVFINHFYISVLRDWKDLISLILIFMLIYFGMQVSKYLSFNDRIPKFLIYLGEISFGIYMWHAVVELFYFRFVPPVLGSLASIPNIAFWTVSFLVIIGVSAAGYHLVEIPARRYINRIG
jgi:peptidoglycan/LPS O-acetylase OafA/YrhL